MKFWLREAERLLSARRFQAAHALLMQVIVRERTNPEALFLLGVLAAEHGNFKKAAELFERAIAADRAQARYHAHLGRALTAMSRFLEAREAAARAAALGPKDALTLDTIGVVYSRIGQHGDAIGFFRRAVAREPGNASFQYNLAVSLQFEGDFAGARAAYETALALDPALYKTHLSLVRLSKQTAENNRTALLAQLFEESGEDADRRLYLGHALAKSYEDLGEWETSLAWLHKAKELKRREVGYAAETDRAVFEAAGAAHPVRANGHPSDAPIFVVGLPRTGTTLVERILSSHSAVASAGESTNFALLAKRMAGTASPLVLDAATLKKARDIDFAQLGRDYVAATRPAGCTRFVDKMPLNFFYSALIHRALPDARIVCLRRGAMDSCLSSYRQLFSTQFPYYNYAYDLAATARYYAMFDALIAQWRAVLPPERFMEMRYESMVENQERETRRLLQFCGLAWEDACLDFQRNAAPVATASSVQVRQPLYATSIGRWKRYGDALAPLRSALAGAGIED